MFVLNVYFCCELRFVATYAPNSDFYSEIQESTQILLRISEEKKWQLGALACPGLGNFFGKHPNLRFVVLLAMFVIIRFRG